jgi:hypothetical protein
MAAFEEMMARLRKHADEAIDPNLSTVGEEINAMDWHELLA